MNKRQFQTGYRHELIEMLMSYGVIPYRSLKYLHGTQESYSRALRTMESEEYIKVKYIGEKRLKKKVAVLNNFESKSNDYIEFFERGYYGFYKNIASRNQKNATHSTDTNRQVRAFKCAEVNIIMQAAGINTLFADKPKWVMGEKLTDNRPYYYNSIEYYCIEFDITNPQSLRAKKNEKNIEIKREEDVKSSRYVGAVTSMGGCYLVYHTGSAPLRWKDKAEIRQQVEVRKCMLAKSEPSVRLENYDKAIIFANRDMTVKEIIENNKENGVLNLACSFKEMYVLMTNTNDSLVMLHNMTVENWRKKLVDLYISSEQYKTDTRSVRDCVIDCHGFTENEYVLLYCIPDIKKLSRFVKNAEAHDGRNKKFTIICYQHQFSFVSTYSRGFCEIKVVDIKEIE